MLQKFNLIVHTFGGVYNVHYTLLVDTYSFRCNDGIAKITKILHMLVLHLRRHINTNIDRGIIFAKRDFYCWFDPEHWTDNRITTYIYSFFFLSPLNSLRVFNPPVANFLFSFFFFFFLSTRSRIDLFPLWWARQIRFVTRLHFALINILCM